MSTLFGPVVDLDPELAPWMRDGGPLGKMLQHPLVYSISVVPEMHGWLNQYFTNVKERVAKAEAAKDWHNYIWQHERAWRLTMLKRLWTSKKITKDELRDILPGVWRDTEFPSARKREVLSLFKAAGYVEDARLPVGLVFKVYRGATKAAWAKAGLSWTLDLKVAEKFAYRWGKEGSTGKVAVAEVGRSQILGYFTERGENEIVWNGKGRLYAGAEN